MIYWIKLPAPFLEELVHYLNRKVLKFKKSSKMRNKNSHTKTIKTKLNKCKTIFYSYSDIQLSYGKELDERDDIIEIKPNVKLEGCEGNYSSDFLCLKSDGSYMVREVLYVNKLMKPLTIKMLDISRNYWLRKGIDDWGLVLSVK